MLSTSCITELLWVGMLVGQEALGQAASLGAQMRRRIKKAQRPLYIPVSKARCKNRTGPDLINKCVIFVMCLKDEMGECIIGPRGAGTSIEPRTIEPDEGLSSTEDASSPPHPRTIARSQSAKLAHMSCTSGISGMRWGSIEVGQRRSGKQ